MRGGDFFIPRFQPSPPNHLRYLHPSGMATITESSYAHLKVGVTLTPRSTDYFLGLPTRGLLLKDPLHVQIVRGLSGRHTPQEIADGLMCDVELVAEFLRTLELSGLIDADSSPLQISRSTERDLSQELIRERLNSELALLTHRAGSTAGGRSEFQSRSERRILISGENRLARNLLVLLQASGFTHTRLIQRAQLPLRIGASDVCGLVVKPADIGKLRNSFTDELIRGAQITKPESASIGGGIKPDLIISTIPVEWDYFQRWMSEGSVHLHINPVVGREIEIGPLVTPGADPCLRCVRLAKRDHGTDVSQENLRSEAPTAAIAYIAGLIALAIGEYFATGESSLRASSHWYDLLNPMQLPEIRHWNFHPECGCQ